MIKVAIISGDSSLTGVPSHVLSLSRNLDKKTFEVLVICPPGPLYKNCKKFGVPCVQIPMRSIFDITAEHAIRTQLVKFKPQIAHFHGMRAGWLGRLAARKVAGLVKIYSEHQWVNELHLRNPAYEQVQLNVLKFLDRWTDKTIAVSKPVADFLIKRSFDKNKIVVIPNGVGEEFLNIKPLPKPEGLPLVIGSIASLNEVKNYRNILLAIAKVKKRLPSVNFHYQIIGEGPQEKALKNLVKAKKIDSIIHFLGRVESIPERLQHITIFINASKSETFGLAVAEAMAAGLPVIVSKIPALEYVVGKTGIFINPRDCDQIADAIEKLIKDQNLRQKLGKAGKLRVTSEFTQDKMIQRISALYKEMTNKTKKI